MNKTVTTGLIAGGMLSVAGITWLMADKDTRKKIAKDGTKALKKASRMMDMN